ncbi:MAG: phosphatidate cytidylyltransferase [Clostridiales bacterium]|nr:phosphatidate cytidylyltransferase [Clostridiales bacterium]
MKTRIKSGVLMLPFLILVFLGGWFLFAGVFALTIFCLREYAGAFGEKRPAAWVFIASAVILFAGYLIPPFRSYIILPWIFVSVILCFLSMFPMEKRGLMQGFATFVGVFYVIFLAFHIVLVDAFPNATDPIHISKDFQFSGIHSFVWIIVLAAFGTDVFAFFTGRLIGSRKLCPQISPNKTVEGAIGGMLGSVILCGLFGWFFLPGGFLDCVIIGLLGGVVSQLGDLSASVLKRHIGVKDWGTLIPGHGGLLDRVDSVLFTAPLVFYYLLFKTAILQAL